jgi:hypothetical protein
MNARQRRDAIRRVRPKPPPACVVSAAGFDSMRAAAIDQFAPSGL